MSNVKIEESWKVALSDEFQQPYFSAIKSFLLKEKQTNIELKNSKNGTKC